MHRRRLLLVGAALLALVPTPALAHPFGPPPTARVAAEGNVVTVDWSSAPDDAIAIGEKIGVLPAGSTEAYRGGVTQVAPSADAEAELAASPLLQTYLLARITVSQDGTPCPTEVAAISDFVNNGARVVATCQAPVAAVELSIRMLTDIHTAYRTFAVARSAEPEQFVYTMDSPVQVWDFSGDARAEGGIPARTLPLPIGIGAALLTAAGILLWRRRRRGERDPETVRR